MSESQEPEVPKKKRYRRKKVTIERQKAVTRFFDHINLEEFENAISTNDDYDSFYRALHDPAYANMSYTHIAKKFGIPIGKLQSIYTDHMRHIGLIRMSTALPQVMADVSEDAKSKLVICPRCDGNGTLATGGPPETGGARECPACNGEKKIRVVGDKHARDLVFESMKLTNQQGPLLALQQNFVGGDDNMESIFKKTQLITVGKKEEPEE